MLTDYYFWFSQPSTILNNYDWVAGYIFAGLVALSLIVWVVRKFFVEHQIVKKLLVKYDTALFWIGLIGLLWFGFRYQAIPIFSKRIFAGSIMLFGLVWLGYVKWYFIRRFFKEKTEFDYNQVKGRYMPQTNK